MIQKNKVIRAVLKLAYRELPIKAKSLISKRLGLYPRVVGKEIKQLKQVLGTTAWNMSYSINGKHVELEKAISNFVGTEYAVAVGSGGVGIQMLTRALGLGPQSEVIMQADTCSAAPQAILNAQSIPVFVDVDTDTFQISPDGLKAGITNNTRMVLATHMWGNPENLQNIEAITKGKDIHVIEDACLALGGKSNGAHLGGISLAGVFSFGSTKPLQAGEGGMIVTNDGELARELRSLRGWGDRETEYGKRDVKTLAWNGRMPEVVAAIALEQLRGYPKQLSFVQNRVAEFRRFLLNYPEISVVVSDQEQELAFTQLSLRVERSTKCTKQVITKGLSDHSIPYFHANFEPITELTLFNSGDWLKWVHNAHEQKNYTKSEFPGAYQVFEETGIGLLRTNFSSIRNYQKLLEAFRTIFGN
jgi:dTDP-4-amino-4,6-dideoxygalactose transaminase